MITSLPQVQVPSLIIHSKDDSLVPFTCMQEIYDHLGGPDKEKLAFAGMGHSMVRDSQCPKVFEAVLNFLTRLEYP
jgi:esterase/lipase